MIAFLNKYKAFGIGLVITVLLLIILQDIGLIIPDEIKVETVSLFVFWWIVISIPIYKFAYLKNSKVVIFKILGLIALLILTLTLDSYFNIPDNPFIFFLLISFWAGVLYVVFPAFFNKYKWYIIGLYALLLSYFFYVRLFSGSFENYADQEKDTAILLLVIPIPMLILLWIFEQWKWLKSLKDGKAKAELELLKTQVNPHFFFNTLNNLYALTVKHSDKAPEVVLKLSDMMRYTIYEGKKDKVALNDEVEYLKNYIDLHKIRYHKKVDIQFTDNVMDNDAVAPLLFIILLENALKHGVESLSDSAYIKMSLTSKDQEILFTLENNFDPAEISEEKGIGLENLKRRLDLIYPKKHELTISEKDNVFKVDLKIKTE
jgi:sensor histidine kinase YesM